MDSLPKRDGNYVPLSPITFLSRASLVYSERTSLVYGDTTFTWQQTYDRCCRLAAALQQIMGISKNNVVSVLAPNTPALYEMHFAVPMAGGVLNAINTLLDAGNVATIIRHAQPKVLFVDYQFIRVATEAINGMEEPPMLVMIHDIGRRPATAAGMDLLEYEQLVARGDPARHPPQDVGDEWDSITLNYTSGTTGAPKGVVYSHRGAYLNTLCLLLQWGVRHEPVYLWSLPMSHCNGWGFTWGIAACGGTNVCIRAPTGVNMYAAIASHGVTHMCAAPVLFNILIEEARRRGAGAGPSHGRRPVEVLTGGAPPPAALLQRIEELGFKVTHAYGMTEATGVAMVCEWRPKWDALLPPSERARLKARQGVSALLLAATDVKDLSTMASVPRDGTTMGEILLRGSNIMKGYFKNPDATEKSFRDGWFLTGDVGVIHPDGYVEIKDRSKDVIISGGENISSVDVESVLYAHPAVREAAVVAMPHPYWGETPCAFISLKAGTGTSGELKEEEVVSFCRSKMAHFMVPKKVVFLDELPKSSTGKVHKLRLRDRARAFSADVDSNSGSRSKL